MPPDISLSGLSSGGDGGGGEGGSGVVREGMGGVGRGGVGGDAIAIKMTQTDYHMVVNYYCAAKRVASGYTFKRSDYNTCMTKNSVTYVCSKGGPHVA